MTTSNKRSLKPVLITFLFLLVLGGLLYWKASEPKGGPGAGPPGGPGGKTPPQKVSGYIVRSESIKIELEAAGSLLAWNEVQLMPEMSGRIVKLNITEGTQVNQGQVLMELFSDDLKAQEKKLRLQADIADKNLKRLRDLLAIKGVSQQEVDNAENTLNNIESDLDIVKANLKKTTLYAPFSGQIGLTNATIGSFANVGVAIASLQQMNPLKLEFSIPEKYTSLLKEGDQVEFTIESQPDTFVGRVYAFEPKIDPATRTLKVRARVDNPGNRLVPGTYARARLRLREITNALLIPTQCLIPETRGKKAIKVRGDSVQFVKVETGIRDQDRVQILSGLKAGDTVLTTGLMFVKPKSEITLTQVK